MWLWPLLILLLSISPICTKSFGAPTHLGPRSEKEAVILWEQGKEAFENHEYQKAVNNLDRFTHRYPAHEGYLEGHLLLGHALLKLKQTQKAVKPLQYVVSANNPSPLSIEARILLGRAFLSLKKYHEALLLSQEVKQLSTSQTIPPTLLYEASLIRIKSLLKLNRSDQAVGLLDRLLAKLTTNSVSRLKAETYSIQLEVKLENCSRLPTQSSLDELQIQDQLGRRGACLLEALLVLQKILDTEEVEFSKAAVHEAGGSFEGYRKACLYPPASPQIPGSHTKRTPIELKRFQSELAETLLQDYQKTTQTAVGLLKTWKPELSGPANQILNMLLNNLENSTVRKNGVKNS